MSPRNFWCNARRAALLSCSALITVAFATSASGQEAPAEGATLGEIIVTAQKREQSLQDVPIAVTAITQDTLKANRITNVTDLSSIAPNVTVLRTLGGVGIPTFGMRGLIGAGSVAGQDKSVSIYLDGVSIASALGSTFDLPDLQRIEVLRGPQGTLFGRNATGGAINVITRDPSGEFRFRQELTYGNYDQLRSVTRVETPAWGPISASLSYTHDERDGDIKNIGAGRVWDRSVAGMGTAKSPKTLGAKNQEAVFAAVKFQPNDNFSTTYKFDWTENHFSAPGNSLAAFTPLALGAATGGLLLTQYNANPVPIAGSDRPKYVNNGFTVPGYQKVYGHNITTNLKINDSLSLKNILAFRKSYIFSATDIAGLDLINVVPSVGPIGAPYIALASQVFNRAEQWSEELQLNYTSDRVTLTAGAIYFDVDSVEGAPTGLARSISLRALPGGVLPRAPLDQNFNSAKSYAAYAQAEVHVTSQIDVVGGYRITKDKKSGTNYVAGSAFPFEYSKTRPSYLIGVNYKPTDDIMAYVKYATGFVAGGVTSTITFLPETVKSWEGGVKADLFDRRLRLNAAAFTADYDNLQAVSGGTFLTPPRPALGTIVITQGNLKTKGVEVEATALPTRGLTLNGSLGYTDWDLSNLNTQFLGPAANYRPQYRAHWTANLAAQYESEPLFGEARLMARLDGNWRSKIRMITRFPTPAGFEDVMFSPSGWTLNGRLALRGMKLSRGELEVALWGRNLTDSDRLMFPVSISYAVAGTYENARTFGVDVIYNY